MHAKPNADHIGVSHRDLIGTTAGAERASVVFDCRWLGYGGAGRLTETALSELRDRPLPFECLLWGDPHRLREYADLGSIIPWSGGHPARLFGQVGLLDIPHCDAIVFFHQSRPITRRRSIAFVLDTIPIRFGSRFGRFAKWLFLMATVRTAASVLTISEFSKGTIVADLRIAPSRVRVASIPVRGSRFDAIAERRAKVPLKMQALYIGRPARHKNVEGLLRGFALSRFAQAGARLVLVGASEAEVSRADLSMVDAIPSCSEDQLDDFLAESQMLLLPSFEEGFGLPAFEAAAVGLPVVATRTGAMQELPDTAVTFCDPRDPNSIADAIDHAAARGGRSPVIAHLGDLGSVLVDTVSAVSRHG